MKTLWNS